MPTTRILLVCANPRGSSPLRTGAEDRTLRQSLQLSERRDDFEVETLNAATIDDLRRALLRRQFDVVHFSGHGTQTGLVFEDEAGTLQVPPSHALAELLQHRKVRIALLNACYSLSTGRLTSIGMEYTIASTGPISDPGAIEFTRGFYDALGAGLDVSDAYAEGKLSARLKGLDIDTVLLRQGDEYVPTAAMQQDASSPSRRPGRSLLGIAVDTSGSMQASLKNQGGDDLSRLASVQEALTEVGVQVRDELLRQSNADDIFQIFVYGFGLRIGTGVTDLASLWRASQRVDLNREIAMRRKRLEADTRREVSGYSDLGDFARRAGLGNFVDSVTQAATSSIRNQIVGEIGDLVVREADRLGDVALTPQELARFFSDAPVISDAGLMEQVFFGDTPMRALAKRIQERFQRMSGDSFANRGLLIVSDGEPTDGDPREALKQIRDSGVDIVACFVTGDDITRTRVLYGTPASSWPAGAKLMWDVASPLDESSEAAQYLLANGWSIEPHARLFVQANHSAVLKEFVRVASVHFGARTASMLPRGR